MTKQEQIEEMCEAIASMICQIYNPQCNEYEPHTCSHCYANDTLIGDFAEMLYNAGYRKIRETDDTLEEQIKHLNTIVERLDELLAKGIDDYIMGIDGVEGLKDMWERSAVKEFAEKLRKRLTEDRVSNDNVVINANYEIDGLLKEYE